MDYGKVLESAYKWTGFKGVAWFAVFFLITVSITVIIPLMLRQGIFFDEPSIPVVQVLYAFNAVVLFVGSVALIEFILKANNFKTQKVTPGKLLDTVFLLVLQVWYIFFWNLHKPYRLIQLLSLFVYTLALFSLTIYNNFFVALGASIFGLAYLIFLIHNCVRLSFSYFIFYNRPLNIKHSLHESWKITEGRVVEILFAFIVGELVIIAYGGVIIAIVAAIASAVLAPSLIPPVAYKVAMLVGALVAAGPMIVGEQFFIAEVYSQVELKHAIKKKVGRILARRTLKKKRPVKKKKAKKRPAKRKAKKAIKKKAKKRAVKKKAKKKPAKKKKSSKKKAKKK